MSVYARHAYVDVIKRYLSIGFNLYAFSLYSLQKFSSFVADEVMVPLWMAISPLETIRAEAGKFPYLDLLGRFHERQRVHLHLGPGSQWTSLVPGYRCHPGWTRTEIHGCSDYARSHRT